jgi:hypothetical protein
MQEQLEPNFLNGALLPKYYTAKVKHRGIEYVIFGTRAEWIRFFKMRPDIDPSGTADQ